MKRTALILASLMMFGSTAAFAEGGAERMRYYFETLRLKQQQANGVETRSIELRVPNDQTAQVTETYRPN
ncbi:hypothetical protein ACYZTM_01110 [Pseudomonas sp. MDT2-39-1]|jgi:hypothetical protein|uniref:hypothetical protein n=1 Tax=Pseudomonas sp. BGI-2 TaxID=2528211 RepID=UPI0010343108|nr:hypothetical protein [Pseudomonas sp. BGI-2]TBN51156.1 hypothetical protein EYC95_00760 [Pseudomonas sp. BGI-2]